MTNAMSSSKADPAPVAVTGIGMICPVGMSKKACWDNLVGGVSGIKQITKFDTSGCQTTIGGELPPGYDEFEKERTPRRLMKQSVRASRLIRVCAEDAIVDSGLVPEKLDRERCGAIVGSSGSSVRSPHDLGDSASERHKVIREMVNAISAWIGIDFGLKGPSYTISAAEVSGAWAVGRSCELIRQGLLDVVVTGGVDCLLTRNYIERASSMGELSRANLDPAGAVKPFDRNRDGGVLADGGCALILESHEHAVRRGASVYGWIRGSAMITLASGPEQLRPSPAGMERCMRMAVDASGEHGSAVGYINANGTATVLNDKHEAEAIRKVFGERAGSIPVSSQKSMIGHCMGAAGALQLAVSALTLKTRTITPTVNYEVPDPECDLQCVPSQSVAAERLEAALTNTFGFGGHLCSILISRSP